MKITAFLFVGFIVSQQAQGANKSSSIYNLASHCQRENELGISDQELSGLNDAEKKALPISVLKLTKEANEALDRLGLKAIGGLWTISDKVLLSQRGFSDTDINLMVLRLDRLGLKRKAKDIVAPEISEKTPIELVGFEKKTRLLLHRMGLKTVGDILQMNLAECTVMLALNRGLYDEVYETLESAELLERWVGQMKPGSLSEAELDRLPIVWLRFPDANAESILASLGYHTFGDLRSLTTEEMQATTGLSGKTQYRADAIVRVLAEWGIEIP